MNLPNGTINDTIVSNGITSGSPTIDNTYKPTPISINNVTLSQIPNKFRYVRIDYLVTNSTYTINLSQIEIYSLTSQITILEKNITTSKDWNTSASPKSNLVDGNTSTWYATDAVQPWIQIDLGESVEIGKIIVQNREDCCEERINTCILSVSNISGDNKNSNSYTFTGGKSTYTIIPSNVVNNYNYSTIINSDISNLGLEENMIIETTLKRKVLLLQIYYKYLINLDM